MVDFQVVSDLHLEMRGGIYANADAFPRPHAPILVLAGDLCPLSDPNFTEIMRRATEGFELTLYVPGNHEYYGCTGTMQDLENLAARKANSVPNVMCINRRTFDVGDITFIGATMWTNPPKSLWSTGAQGMNDYSRIIKTESSTMTPSDTVDAHNIHASFIKKSIESAKKRGKSGAIVITHHVPDIRLSKQTGSRPRHLFPFYFASDMAEMTCDPFVKVWCYGHSHESHCVKLDPWGPLFACNSKGYPRENTGYTEDSVIRVA